MLNEEQIVFSVEGLYGIFINSTNIVTITYLASGTKDNVHAWKMSIEIMHSLIGWSRQQN